MCLNVWYALGKKWLLCECPAQGASFKDSSHCFGSSATVRADPTVHPKCQEWFPTNCFCGDMPVWFCHLSNAGRNLSSRRLLHPKRFPLLTAQHLEFSLLYGSSSSRRLYPFFETTTFHRQSYRPGYKSVVDFTTLTASMCFLY
jgi:hypothetical protein